ncbi:hypothetical protein AVEN_109851-1 [Araneus ventricosus]|uniref:Uncharacterized protein n=1 Tax=Araneus ventricosus TaxID=182803 RepID=A0A4Y2L558_ARAVE|nr:hypothetical protein AVEN_109851-1 [Araneus ventricosus]
MVNSYLKYSENENQNMKTSLGFTFCHTCSKSLWNVLLKRLPQMLKEICRDRSKKRSKTAISSLQLKSKFYSERTIS